MTVGRGRGRAAGAFGQPLTRSAATNGARVMADRLSGKRVFATACAAGIGRACALAMAAEGAHVIATDVDVDGLARLAAENRGPGVIEPQALDARDRAAIEAAAAEAGAPDALLNATGLVHQGTVLETDEAAWAASLELNVTAHFRIIRAFLPAMIAAGGGAIVTIASAVGVHKGAPNRAAYSATKAALIGLTRAVAADHVGQGVRANAICPGSVDTPSLEARMRALGGDYETVRRRFVDRAPMGRMARADEIAALAVYLASDEAAFVTGESVVIDGGWSL